MNAFPTSGANWSLRRAVDVDRSAIHRLWAESFGTPGDDVRSWLDRALGDAPVACWVGTDRSGRVVGFIVTAVGDRPFVRDYLNGHAVVDSLPTRVSVIHMLGVDPEWRSKGVATGLVQRSIDWASERTSILLVVLWRREDHVDSSGLASKFGFAYVCTLEEFYEGRPDCPDCGDACSCRATVHVVELE